MSEKTEPRIVVVSGASRGIGFAIAKSFAHTGAQTILAASSESNLAAAVSRIAQETAAPPPVAVAADLRTIAGCRTVHDVVAERFGRCDVLVNSAGATRAGAFLTQPDEEWDDGFALKFFSCVRLCRLFWPMLRTAEGFVVNIIGGAARTPDPEFLVGGSVNAAMANFTKGLSGLGKREGVNVNAILPGLTETERIQALFEQRAAATGITADQARRDQIAREGIRRLGRPEDVAELALFLADDRARHIQGTAIAVDGGGTAGLY
ncbi:NAD(P)-dependent dehydrogenase (short-subunit alcohol dehydrogenase family) [Azospirillum lipoferum]|uniref:SDR family oxidoreductase n=1 Tax=Azospirillum lipoferum TaxID=193 RepID=A0A5A9GKJ1_AZOLI|nr:MULTISPECIES: SDR family oxidoreductase [Azospirillum]KAA0594921.1 SDR family oxidoreductase [Azospirillum lipoferum]MCP1612747.1 NAD(P)-dependent dehydrogenase (short-subunit alcohol dehydrogenase family) [Azospirillum lipoferum]MDW5532116.1 SDR family oxidoreductase [Azospirillum sp. NL1]